MFAPYSGDAAAYGAINDMTELIYDQVNAKGGINGRKVKLKVVDSQCDPTQAQGFVRRLVSQDQVFMINGGICSNVVLAAEPLIAQLGVPYLVEAASSGQTTDPPRRNVFAANPSAIQIAGSIAKFVNSSPDHKLAIVSENDEYGQSWHDPLVSALKGTSVHVVANEKIGQQTGDASGLVSSLLKAKPDMVAAFAYPQPMSVFLRNAASAGLDVPVISGDTTNPLEQASLVGAAGPVKNFISAYYYKHSLDSPQYSHYKAMLAKAHPKDAWNSLTMLGVTGALANIQILKEMGNNLTWTNYVRTAEKLRNFDTDVNAGPVSFAPFDPHNPSTRRGSATVYFSSLAPGNDKKLRVFQTWNAWNAGK